MRRLASLRYAEVPPAALHNRSSILPLPGQATSESQPHRASFDWTAFVKFEQEPESTLMGDSTKSERILLTVHRRQRNGPAQKPCVKWHAAFSVKWLLPIAAFRKTLYLKLANMLPTERRGGPAKKKTASAQVLATTI
jgi:hypothetical protein